MGYKKPKPTARELLEHVKFVDTKLNASYSNLKSYIDTLNGLFYDYMDFKGDLKSFETYVKNKYPEKDGESTNELQKKDKSGEISRLHQTSKQ